MDTERLTHTAASLAALAPRELDALAHDAVLGVQVFWRACSQDPANGNWDDAEMNDFYPRETLLQWAHDLKNTGIGYAMQPCSVDERCFYPDDLSNGETDYNGIHEWRRYFDVIPNYSTSLDAAALLEAELARRGIMPKYNMTLCDVVGFDIVLRPCDYCPTIQGGAYYDPVDPAWLAPIIRASAKSRTIAAILAVQDSPYLQIVTWDKHPKDAANSQSAQGAK